MVSSSAKQMVWLILFLVIMPSRFAYTEIPTASSVGGWTSKHSHAPHKAFPTRHGTLGSARGAYPVNKISIILIKDSAACNKKNPTSMSEPIVSEAALAQ
jgi:hypothetical protein